MPRGHASFEFAHEACFFSNGHFGFMTEGVAMIESFEEIIDGQTMRFCASLGEGESTHRVIISRADSAETLVVFDAAGLFGSLKADMESPEKLIADAIRKARDEGLIKRALDTGKIQNATL
jgi:hypothetical protein